MTQQDDSYFIKKTLLLAKKGVGWVNPNPMVGAVIVKNGEIISQGYHKRAGLAHAEIEAINSAREKLKNATLYVNLEPCSHHGKTPPCTEAIIKSGINRVVFSVTDPNPAVLGGGVIALKKAGIKVTTGILENEARELNEAFFTFHEKKRPFIAIKFASSLDGKIATKTGDSKWISNEKARKYSHILRSRYQAILVGSNTVLHDDPHLGSRLKGKRDPIRIIIDPTLKIPLTSKVLRNTNILIISTRHADKFKLAELKKRNIDLIKFNTSEIPLTEIIKELSKREIISILVEGGGETIGRFVDQKLVDKVYAFHSPILIGGKTATSAVMGTGFEKVNEALRLTGVSHKLFDDTVLTIGKV